MSLQELIKSLREKVSSIKETEKNKSKLNEVNLLFRDIDELNDKLLKAKDVTAQAKLFNQIKSIAGQIKTKLSFLKESVNLKEEVAGWIAILDGKKVEVRKGEADSLYSAKKLAIKKFAELFGRPLSKARELQISIEPAYDDADLEGAPASSVQFEAVNKKSASRKYNGYVVFATLIQPNMTSVTAQVDVDNAQGSSSKRKFEEIIYRTDNLEGAIDAYIKQIDNGNALVKESKDLKEGEYQKTYDKIAKLEKQQKELKAKEKKLIAQGASEEELEKVAEELGEINQEIGECRGYIKELETIDGVNESKNLKEAPVYDLSARHDSRKEFYGKARVDYSADGKVETLISYSTPVARVTNGKLELLPAWNASSTTLRHVKEFMKQHGFKAESSAQIAKDFGAKEESVVTESKDEIVVNCPDMSLQEMRDYCDMWQCDVLNTGVKGKYKLVGKDAEVAREELKADGHIQESVDVKEQIQETAKEFRIEYWATEEDREEGFGDIFMELYYDKEEAIAVAKKMVDRDGMASVEVIDENDEVVFGYDGAETWKESLKMNEAPDKYGMTDDEYKAEIERVNKEYGQARNSRVKAGGAKIGENAKIQLFGHKTGINYSLSNISFNFSDSYRKKNFPHIKNTGNADMAQAVEEIIRGAVATPEGLAKALNDSKIGHSTWKTLTQDDNSFTIQSSDPLGNLTDLRIVLFPKEKKFNESKVIDESLKIISDISQYEPWAGAVETWNKIEEEGLVDTLEDMLEDMYPEGLTVTQLNDILWFDSEMILEQLGIAESDDEDEEYEEEEDEDNEE